LLNVQVDKVVVNRYWGLGVPNYSQLTAVSQWPAFVTDTAKRYYFSTFSAENRAC